MAQINKTNESVKTTRLYEVTGAEPLRVEYRTISFQPDSLVVGFLDGKWHSASVTGWNIRKDGSLGDNRHTNIYRHTGDLPEWAVPLTRFEEEDVPDSLAQRMENDASSYDNDPEPWGED